jgi:hypothetical protein
LHYAVFFIDMADDDVQRGTAKRQIARLIGNTSVPIYVLGDGDQLLFANDALAELLGVDADALIGLDCSNPIPSDDSPLAAIASRLALPPNTDRSLAQFFSVSILDRETSYLGLAFPLEHGPLPMTFCSIKPDQGDRESIRGFDHRGNLHRVLSLPMPESCRSAELWFLQGTSPAIARTRAQIHAAIQSKLGVHISGSGSSTNLAVAKWIAHQRIHSRNTLSSHRDAMPARESIIVIECRLMDRDLLRGMLEMATEQSQLRKKAAAIPALILHQIDQLASELIEPLGNWYRSSKTSLFATSNHMDLIQHRPNDREWGSLVASIDSHVVHVPSLNQRTDDIEVLVAAWLEWFGAASNKSKIKYRWTQSLIDAMIAYPWPGDIQEMDEALRIATRSCSEYLLAERDLPAPLRTYPSHTQRPEPLPKLDLDAMLEQFERQLLEQALAHFPRNRTAVANHLGISRARLLRRLQQLGLDSKVKSPNDESDTPVFEDWNEEDSGTNP